MYHLLFVDGWDAATGEAIGGGRTLESLPTLRQAHAAYVDWLRVVTTGPVVITRGWGAGLLVVTDADGHRIDLAAEDIEEALARAA